MSLIRPARIGTRRSVAALTYARPAPGAIGDWEARSPEIHWPNGLTPVDADIFAHNELFIRASVKRIWQHLVDAERWTDWYPNVSDVDVSGTDDGLLAAGVGFSCQRLGLETENRVYEFVSHSRIAWFSDAQELSSYQTWYFIPDDTGCRLVVEEVARGRMAVALRRSDAAVLHRSNELWLRMIKQITEL